MCRILVLLEGSGGQPGPHACGRDGAASRTIVHASGWSRAASPRAPAPSKEAVGKPTVHLSSSPQAEVSHIAFQPGALHPNFLPPQQRQPRLALCLVPEHRGRRVEAGSHLGGLNPWMMWRFCANPSSPQTVPSQHRVTPRPARGLGTH